MSSDTNSPLKQRARKVLQGVITIRALAAPLTRLARKQGSKSEAMLIRSFAGTGGDVGGGVENQC